MYPQLSPVFGAPWGCCGHASGIYFPRPLWYGGCATHATPCSVPGYSYFRMCLEKSEHNCLTRYKFTMQQFSRVSFLFACLKGCFRLSWSTITQKFIVPHIQRTYVCVCVFSSHSLWTSNSLDVPAGVTQEEGHTGFLIQLISAVRALIFLARRIQPFLSLVDRDVEFYVLTIQSFSTRWAFF